MLLDIELVNIFALENMIVGGTLSMKEESLIGKMLFHVSGGCPVVVAQGDRNCGSVYGFAWAA